MTRTILKANKRIASGKGSNKKLRREKQVPAILYGAHIEEQMISIKENDIILFLNHNHMGTSLDLDIDGEKHFVILKDIQVDPVSHKVIHMDFQALKLGEEIKVTIPIYLSGQDNLRNLVCQELLSELEISCLPKNLIDRISLDVSDAVDGTQVLVSDLEVFSNPDIEVLNEPDSIVYIVNEAKEFVEEEVETDEIEESEEATSEQEEQTEEQTEE